MILGQRTLVSPLGGNAVDTGAVPRGDESAGLGADRRARGGECPAIDDVGVWVDLASYHRLAEAVAAVHDQFFSLTCRRVGGEQDSGDLGVHQPLDHDRHCDRVLFDGHVVPVCHGPCRVERRPAFAHRRKQVVPALNIEIGVLLASEGQLWKIFGRCRGTHGDGGIGDRLVDLRR